MKLAGGQLHCRQAAKGVDAGQLWTFLIHPDLELTNNASERALRSVVIARKLSMGVQSTWGGQLVGRIMTVTTSLEQQGRDARVDSKYQQVLTAGCRLAIASSAVMS